MGAPRSPSEDESGQCADLGQRLASGQVIGSTRLFDLDPYHLRGEIGFTWLAAPYRGSGVNPRVKLLQLTHAFETLGLRRVALKTHHENLQSQRGILKLERKVRRHLPQSHAHADGSTRHTVWYSIVAGRVARGERRSLLQRIAGAPGFNPGF